jgi:2-polyprenyl-3-methyl-5-hydroxy-6-metoxy-1,4-benzoquinol methylase
MELRLMNQTTDKTNKLLDFYNQSWTNALANEREDFGDLGASLQFIEQNNIPRESKILEIRCATGKLCHELSIKGFYDVVGIDISNVAIHYGKAKYPHLSLHSYDGNDLNFLEENFDICLSFDVVEHIPDINKHFQSVINILSPSGKYLFQTPNILSNSVIETIKNKGKMTWKIYHPSLQSSFSLKKKLIQAGFQKVEFIKISPLTEYKLASIPVILRYPLKVIPFIGYQSGYKLTFLLLHINKVYMQLGDWEKTQIDFDKALEITNKYSEIHQEIKDIFVKRGLK